MESRTGLALTWESDTKINFSAFETATIDLQMPTQDRSQSADVAGTGANAKSSAKTAYLESIKTLATQTMSPYGSFSIVPESGQLIVRDQRENLAVLKDAMHKINAVYRARYDVSLSFYRVYNTTFITAEMNLSGAINDRLSLAFGSPLAATLSPAALTLTNRKVDGVLSLLSELGSVEALDSYQLLIQGRVPSVSKIARNIDYIKSISQSTAATPGAGTGTITSWVEQGTVTDGSYLSIVASEGDAGTINLDLHAKIVQNEGLKTTTTGGQTIQSPTTFERAFDTFAAVTHGVPYVLAVAKQTSRLANGRTLPGLEGAPFGALLGGKSDSAGESYIVAIVEARKL